MIGSLWHTIERDHLLLLHDGFLGWLAAAQNGNKRAYDDVDFLSHAKLFTDTEFAEYVIQNFLRAYLSSYLAEGG